MQDLSVFELRNYTLHPGQRDVLIELFERCFIESQEELGSYVLGTFRNLDDPDRFVWVRGFADMQTRLSALSTFYADAVWQDHRSVANATMTDSDNVLLLRRVSGSLARDSAARPPVGATAIPDSVIVATTYPLRRHGEEDFAPFFAREVAPHLREAGGEPIASLATEYAANTYPRLPVRENETVFVSLAQFASAQAHAAHVAKLAAWPAWARVKAVITERCIAPVETLRLQPTARSLLR